MDGSSAAVSGREAVNMTCQGRSLGLLACLGIALIARASGAQERLDRLTLDDAVNTAIRHNATLRIANVNASALTFGYTPNSCGK